MGLCLALLHWKTLPPMTYLSSLLALILLVVGCSTDNWEAEQALNAIILLSRSQEAFYVEHGKFTDRLEDLKVEWLNLKQTTPNYSYQIRFLAGETNSGVVTLGLNSKSEKLIAIVHKSSDPAQFTTTLCRGKKDLPPIVNPVACPPGFSPIVAKPIGN